MMAWLLALSAGTFVVDQLTKAWALERLDPTLPVVVLPGLFQLVLVMNPGVAFGLFAGIPPGWRWIVTVFSVTALVLLCSLAIRVMPGGGRLGRTAIGLVLGGAVGNLLDRWRHGAVVDFVDVFWRQYHWPAFNVADSAITIGVLLLGIELVAGGERGLPREPADA